jgi:hypothetical protein
MPYVVRKIRNEPFFSVKNAETGKVHSAHATKANAMKQVKLLMSLSGGAKANGRIRVGMGLSKKDIASFITASYAKPENAQQVNDYVLDNQLSTKKNKVYVNPEKKVIIANAGTSDMFDWFNNAYVPLGLYHTTKRYKDTENIQKQAIDKYGKENITNVGHSQSGEALRNLADRGLTNEAVALNPYIIMKPHKGVDVIRSSGDLVSLLTPNVKETIPSKSRNPYTEHMPNVLGRGKGGRGNVGRIHDIAFRKLFGGRFDDKDDRPVVGRYRNIGHVFKDSFTRTPFTFNPITGRSYGSGRYTPRQFGKDFVTITTLGLAPQGRIGGKSCRKNKK